MTVPMLSMWATLFAWWEEASGKAAANRSMPPRAQIAGVSMGRKRFCGREALPSGSRQTPNVWPTGGGGVSDPRIPVEVKVMLRLAPELPKVCFCVLVLQATPYSTCSIVHHGIARYHPYRARYTVHAALCTTV